MWLMASLRPPLKFMQTQKQLAVAPPLNSEALMAEIYSIISAKLTVVKML